MAFDPITKCLGLVSQYNPLDVQPGALVKADNCFIRRENVIEDRRGYLLYSTLAGNILQYLTFSNRILTSYNTNVINYDNGSGTFADYSGTYTPRSGSKIRYAEGASNLYITSSSGIKVLYDVSGTAGKSAGVPRCLDLSYALNAAGTGFLATGFQCAYRAVLQRLDQNSNLVSGAPSQRLWVINTSGVSKNVDLTVYLPSEMVAGDILQFYRTTQQSGTTTDTSGDEESLVYQYTLTSTDISNTFVSFTDVLIDALQGNGNVIYTAASQEGASQENERPPVSKDIALYKSRFMFYANTSTKQRLFFTMVGTGSLSGKTITLGGITYNFGATEIISGGGSPQVKVFSTGVTANDIDNTARSLVRVINRYASNTTVYAYYLSGADSLPGQISIEERGIGASAYTIQSSDAAIGAMFYPPPPVSPATNAKSTSSNDVKLNGLYYSKEQQFEAVPLLNYFPVGPANKQILRIVALRDSLIIVKEEGVYRVSGDDPGSFVVTPLDLTVSCKSEDSVASLANEVFMLSNQGVVAIAETGVQVVSRDIEPLIIPLLTYSNISTNAVGVAYETERSYFLSVLSNTADTVPTQTFVYNIFTKSWVRHTFGFTAAVVEPSADKLFIAYPSSALVIKERKDFTDSDYADPESSCTITAISGRSISFSTSTTPQIGWVLSQGGSGLGISSIMATASGYTVVVDNDPPSSWAAGAATLYPSVGMQIEWAPWHASQPGLLKQVRGVCALVDNAPGVSSVTSFIMTFRSNFDDITDEVPMNQGGSGWGSGPWGSFGWGGSGDSYGYPTLIPKNKQYCRLLKT